MPLVDHRGCFAVDGDRAQMDSTPDPLLLCGCKHVSRARNRNSLIADRTVHNAVAAFQGGRDLNRRKHIARDDFRRVPSEPHGAVPTAYARAHGNSREQAGFDDPTAQKPTCTGDEYFLHGSYSLAKCSLSC
jgi:hypothetical protein